jgi:hypothetical protein
MDLVIVFGPPAVGKMTVGREICALTGYKLFHNHMSIEPLLGIFDFDSPQFSRLSNEFRRRVIEEAVDADLPGLVFTFVWGVELEEDRDYIAAYADIVLSRGGGVRFVELSAPQEQRLLRNEGESRQEHKASKRDLLASRRILLELDAKYVLSTGEQRVAAHELLGKHDFLRIDNTDLEPGEVAEQVVAAFGLPRVS